jgi:hypothetical protein
MAVLERFGICLSIRTRRICQQNNSRARQKQRGCPPQEVNYTFTFLTIKYLLFITFSGIISTLSAHDGRAEASGRRTAAPRKKEKRKFTGKR